MNEYKIEKKFSFENLIFSIETMLLSPYIETAPKVGIDNKKEIFDASNLLNFNNLPAVIVIPALLTPGIKEKV